MSVRARALFFASLALVVGQLALPGRASTPGNAEASAPVFEPVQVHHEPHPASYGARSWHPDRPTDRVGDAPFAPSSRARSRPLSPVEIQPVEPSRSGSSTLAFRLLPPSRAPPALS